MAKKKNPKSSIVEIPASEARFPSWLAAAVCVVWAGVVFYNYQLKTSFFSVNVFDPPLWFANIDRFGSLLVYLPQTALLFLIFVFALSVGAPLLRLLCGREREPKALSWLVFSLGLGFGALSYAMLAMGFLGLYTKAAVYSLLAAGCVAGAAAFGSCLLPGLRDTAEDFKRTRFSWFDRFLITLLGLNLLLALTWTLTPEIFFDALFYHLGVPNFYLQEGRIAPMPFNLSSAFPFVMQMLYTAALLLSGDTLAKLVHFSTGLFLLATIFALARRYASVTAALTACLIFFSMPLVTMNMTTTGVEIGSAWFTLLALYALLLSFSPAEGSAGSPLSPVRESFRLLLLPAVCAGFACGTKYPSLFTVIAGAAVLAYKNMADPASSSAPGASKGSAAARQVLIFGALTALVFSPWPLKNLVYHGNPLYPFLGKIFGGQQVDPDKWLIFLGDGWSRDLSAVFSNFSELGRFLFHPWYLTMGSMSNADFVGPFILAALPLFLVFKVRSEALRRMLVFFTVMWALWCLSTRMPRYFLPALAVLSVPLAVFITEAGKSRFLRFVCRALLVVVFLFSLQWLNKIMGSQDGWRVVFGFQDREQYLARQHSTYPTPYYNAMKYINSRLPPDSKVLFAGETRSYYCGRRYIASSVHDVHPLVKYARACSTPEEMQAKIKADGITHIFLNLNEAVRLQGYSLFQWDERSAGVFAEWWSLHAELEWSQAGGGPENYGALFVYKVADSVALPARNFIYDIYARGKR